MSAGEKSGKRGISEPIASKDNRWLKQFRAALREGQIEGDLIGMEGPHLVEEALRAQLETVALLVSPAGEAHLGKVRHQVSSVTQILRTSHKLFASVSATPAPQGIAALARIHRATLDDVLTTGPAAPLILVLVAMQDPGNVGTLLRAAEGLGATGAIVTSGSAHPWGQKSLRASAGSALRLPILAGIAPSVAMAQLRVARVQLVATAVREGALPSVVDWQGPTALLVGNEGAGLPAEVLRSADKIVRIPLAPHIESLNAAVAASVLLYEAARQRGVP